MLFIHYLSVFCKKLITLPKYKHIRERLETVRSECKKKSFFVIKKKRTHLLKFQIKEQGNKHLQRNPFQELSKATGKGKGSTCLHEILSVL